MIKILKDRSKTRIVLEAVTSYSEDYDVNYTQHGTTLTLILSLGSAVRKLIYINESDRASDVKDLDEFFGAKTNVDNNIR